MTPCVSHLSKSCLTVKQDKSCTPRVCLPVCLSLHITCTVGPPSFLNCAGLLVLYSGWSGKEMRKGSSRQSSGNMSLHFGRSQFDQGPFEESSTVLDFHFSSSWCWTSASLLCLSSTLPHCWKWVPPSPTHAQIPNDVPQIQHTFRLLSDMPGVHLHHGLMVTPALLTF